MSALHDDARSAGRGEDVDQSPLRDACKSRSEPKMTKHTDDELKHDKLTVAWAKSFGAAHDMMQDALKAISYHADNQDIGHVDFRMHAKRCADHTLEQCAGPPGILDPAPWPKPDWEDMASLRAALQAAERERDESNRIRCELADRTLAEHQKAEAAEARARTAVVALKGRTTLLRKLFDALDSCVALTPQLLAEVQAALSDNAKKGSDQ